jgi:hypothetical protein
LRFKQRRKSQGSTEQRHLHYLYYLHFATAKPKNLRPRLTASNSAGHKMLGSGSLVDMQNEIVLRAMASVLGPDNVVVRDVEKAMRTDDGLDWLIAKAAFQALTRAERQEIAELARWLAEDQLRSKQNIASVARGR